RRQDDGRGARGRTAEASVESDRLARRCRAALALALCTRACAGSRRGLHAQRARGMAADRVAEGRDGANEILALPLATQRRLPPLQSALRNPPPATCRSRRLPTPRHRRCGLSGTSPTPSPPCAASSSLASPASCHDVLAARRQLPAKTDARISDAVRLRQAH